jgi:PST family polysaccharide transporter
MSRVLLSIGAVQVLIMLVGLIRAKVLSLLLGPADFGIVSTIDQVVLTLVSLGALSLPFTALKFLSRSHGDGIEPFRRTFASFLRGLALLGAATAALAFLLLLSRPGLLGAEIAAHRGATLIAVLGVPSAMLTVFFVNAVAAAQRASASALLNLAVAAALVLGAVLGELAAGIPGLYIGTVVAGIVATVASLAYLRRTLGLHATDPGAGLVRALKENPEIASYSGFVYLAMTAYALTMLGARLLVLSELGAVPAGLFQAVLSLALTVGAVMTPMSNLFLAPLVNRRLPVESKVAAANDFARTMSVLLLVAALPIVLFPRLALVVLFSQAFAAAAGALFVFVAWQCVYQLVNAYSQLLIGLDDVRFISLATVAGFAGAAALFPVLVPAFGLGGAALALLVGMALVGLAAALRLRLRHGARAPWAVFLRAGFCVGAIVVAGLLFREGAGEWTPGGVGLRGAYAAGVAGILWMILAPAERRALAAMLTRLPGGRRAFGAHVS